MLRVHVITLLCVLFVLQVFSLEASQPKEDDFVGLDACKLIFFTILPLMNELYIFYFQMGSWSQGGNTILRVQQSYICPPQMSPAHCPSWVVTGGITLWRARGSFVADSSSGKAAGSGKLTRAPGRKWSVIWLTLDVNLFPGLQTAASELTSLVGTTVKPRQLLSHLKGPRSRASNLNMIQSK